MTTSTNQKRSAVILLGGLVFSALLALTGCGPSGGDAGPLGECPTDSTAQASRGADVLNTKCNTCHATTVEGVSRNGAPPDSNFDDAAVVQEEAVEMYERAEKGEMPPGAGLSDAEVEDLRVHLACTTK